VIDRRNCTRFVKLLTVARYRRRIMVCGPRRRPWYP